MTSRLVFTGALSQSRPSTTVDDAARESGRWCGALCREGSSPSVGAYHMRDSTIWISVGGGTDPAWRKDGAELFYLAADRRP